jgi:hypothetical protein
MLLLENNFQVPGSGSKKAYLVEKNMPADKMQKIMALAKEEREAGTIINVSIMKKNKKFQKEQMEKGQMPDGVSPELLQQAQQGANPKAMQMLQQAAGYPVQAAGYPVQAAGDPVRAAA